MKEIILTTVLTLIDVIGAIMTIFALDKLFFKKEKIVWNTILLLGGVIICIATIMLAEKLL